MVEQNKERQKSMSNILLLEDDLSLINGLSFAFKKQGFELNIARTLKEAEKLWTDGKYDLLVLDVSLPDGSGFEFCKRVRLISKVPIIFLTASDEETSIIMGLDIGGDDYITKPFSMPVLLRKIAAVLRRSNRETDEKYQIITYGNLLLNCDSYTATVDGANFELTQKEFEILRELLTHQGRILTRQNLLDKLWRYDFYGDERVVDTHIKNLRKKLGIDFIQTIRGVGYKVDKEN